MAFITFLPISHLERTKCNIQKRVGITIFFIMIVQMQFSKCYEAYFLYKGTIIVPEFHLAY